MKPQTSFTLLVLVTVLALIGAAEWTQSRKSAAQQHDAFYANLNDKASEFQQTLKSKIEALRNELAQTASKHSDSTKVLSADSPFSAIAWLKKNPQGSTARYKAVWAESNGQTFDPSWLRELNFSQVKDGESLFVRKVDRYGNPFFALVTTAISQAAAPETQLPEQAAGEADDRVYLFAALAPNVLNSWVDEYVGSSMSALAFDESGNVVAHSQRQYSGTNLKQDKFVSSSFRSGRSQVTQEFLDGEGEKRVGESLKLSQTNLRVAVTLPQAAIAKFKGADTGGSQRSLMVLIGSFLVLAAHFLGRKFSNFAKPAADLSPRHARRNPIFEIPASTEEIIIETQVAEPLTMEDVEKKTKVNIEEILAKSQEIRKRLQLDFIESVETVEAEQKVLDAPAPTQRPEPYENLPKVKVRRPKVSL